MRKQFYKSVVAIGLLGLLVGCGGPLVLQSTKGSYVAVDSTAQEDPTVLALIQPYKQSLDAQMNEVLCQSKQELTKGFPEGRLNHFVADLMLSHARATVDKDIDFSVINLGGLRVPLPKGPVTLGKVYELMPFDNRVVVLTISPETTDSLFIYLAEKSEGEAGMTFGGIRAVVQGGKFSQMTINGQPFDRTRSYKIVTIDYLADGGSNLTMLRTRLDYNDTGAFLRDFIAAYLRQQNQAGTTIDCELDGRLVITPQSN